jgi:DNA polymerase III subunit delta
MDIRDVEKDLANGTLKPVYLLFGQEHVLRDQLLSRFLSLVPEGLRDLNLQILTADDTPPGDVLSQARTLPFMTGPRLIVLRGIDRYSVDDLNRCGGYLDDPNEKTCLVLVADSPDFRLKFFKTIRQKGLDVSFSVPKGKGLVQWVKTAMKRRDQEISDAAAQELIDRIGSDPSELDGELEKLSLYALGRRQVTVDDVRVVSRLNATSTVFQLGDALGEQSPERSLAALNELLLNEPHLKILIMLIRHFRFLLKAGILLEETRSVSEAAGGLEKVPPFAARKFVEQAKYLTVFDIKKGLARLMDANLTLISSRTPQNLVMERLVLELSSLKMSPRPDR